jgi:hypothetical protein
MTRTARRRLFYALLALFFILGTGVVFYAQGWRFDFTARRFNKVGAIYVRSFPADASITLNGKLIQSQVGFLSRGTLVSDLFPKIYKVELTKSGYDSWHENVSVSPSLVAELNYAVLVPQNATSVASGTIADFLVSQKKLLAANASGTALTMAANGMVLKKNKLAIGSSTIAGPNQKIQSIRNGLLGILQTDGSFYLFDAGSRNLQKLADDVKDFATTDDGSTVAALERKSIEIFSLNDPRGYYRFNLPDVGGIERLIWYKDKNHLFVAYKNSVSLLDLADAGLNNFTAVVHGTAPAYDPQANVLYILNPSQKWMRLQFPE